MAEAGISLPLHTLIKINNITGFLPLDLYQVLRVISTELEKLFPPYRCCFLLLEKLDFSRDPQGATAAGSFLCQQVPQHCRVIKEQLPMVICNGGGADKKCCPHQCNQQQLARICVPLISGTEVMGAISLKSSMPVTLTRDQMEILLAIANQTAATIQRARLFNRIEQEKERLLQANQEIAALNRALQNTIRDLKAAQRQLILSERLAAIGHLTANLAHEINNPVGIILSRLECMELEAGELKLPAAALKDLAVIKKHAGSIAKIVRGLLAFSRQPLQEVQTLSLNQLLTGIVEWLAEHFARKGIQITLDLNELPTIKGNPDQLQQVFINILTNARDALPGGGEIVISSRVNTISGKIEVNIKDNGVGISPANIDKIFEPFFTTKEVGSGTGLGLSISYGIIKEHGGDIEVHSEEGRGTVFTIILPPE